MSVFAWTESMALCVHLACWLGGRSNFFSCDESQGFGILQTDPKSVNCTYKKDYDYTGISSAMDYYISVAQMAGCV